jgi:hypothetical protein
MYAIAIDRAIGRPGMALLRAGVLADLCRERGLLGLLPDAWSIQAELALLVDDQEKALAAAGRALTALATGPFDPDSAVRAIRVLIELRAPGAVDALAEWENELRGGGLTDVEGQVLALHARTQAQTDPKGAMELANQARERTTPADPRAWFDRTMDVARALIDAGAKDQALAAIAELDRADVRGMPGIWVEVLWMRARAGDDVASELQEAEARVVARLSDWAVAGWKARAARLGQSK